MDVNLSDCDVQEDNTIMHTIHETNKLTTNAGSARTPTLVVPTMTTVTNATTATTPSLSLSSSSKTLKRCLSVPTIRTLPGTPPSPHAINAATMTTRSAAAAAAAIANYNRDGMQTDNLQETPKKHYAAIADSSTGSVNNFGSNIHIGIPRSHPCSREVSPAPVFNIFAPRARRYSASYSPLNGGAGAAAAAAGAPLCMTPRVSQLRQEECADINSREVNHEREVHSAMQMSQSWEDLTLVAENWSCKSDEFSNPLQVVLPSGISSCSSPSPTSNRAGLRIPYGLSPSPTRRTFATRRSMSPIAMRPSQLGPVKRKFELEDNTSNWNYSAPPAKKIFTESRGSSPVCQSPSSVCPSPDSGTYDGRNTPKFFISKLCTTHTNNNNSNNGNNNSSACSSPVSASPLSNAVNIIDSTATSALCSSSSSSSSSSAASSMLSNSEPMCTSNSIDEGISVSETEEKLQCPSANTSRVQTVSNDMQDESTLMDDNKSETSSIGGCSSISIESSSCDSGAKTANTFFNKLRGGGGGGGVGGDDVHMSPLSQKHFFINKQGCAKKFIVNHDNLPNSSSEQFDSISVSSTTSGTTGAIAGEEDTNTTTTTTTTSGMNQLPKAIAANVIVENKI